MNKAIVSNVVPQWIQDMRAAVSAALKPEDVKVMIQRQVDKAKEGDVAATKFVLDYVLGGMDLKGATFIQKNYYGKRKKKPAGFAAP